MSEPVKAEVWMRVENSDELHRVGTITYEEMDLEGGAVSLDGFSDSITDFIARMNEVLAKRQAMDTNE